MTQGLVTGSDSSEAAADLEENCGFNKLGFLYLAQEPRSRVLGAQSAYAT